MGRLITAALALYSFLLIRGNIANMPARIPTHFNAAGEPNAWGNPNILWHLLLIQVLTCGGLLLVPLLTRRFPGTVHLGRRKLKDFAPEQQERVLGMLTAMMEYLTVPLSFLFAVLVHDMIAAGTSPQPHLAIWWAMAVYIFGTAAILIHYVRRIDSATDGTFFRQRSARQSPSV